MCGRFGSSFSRFSGFLSFFFLAFLNVVSHVYSPPCKSARPRFFFVSINRIYKKYTIMVFLMLVFSISSYQWDVCFTRAAWLGNWYSFSNFQSFIFYEGLVAIMMGIGCCGGPMGAKCLQLILLQAFDITWLYFFPLELESVFDWRSLVWRK